MKKKLLLLLLMGSFYSLIGIVLSVTTLSLALANDAKSQDVKSVREAIIEIGFYDATAEEIFNKIEAVTSYEFVYFRNDLNKSLRLNLRNSKISVADLLLMLSEECNLSFRQENNFISVRKISGKAKNESKLEIIIQNKKISGRVTSMEDDEGLPGVNVVEKGTSNGTVTDINGDYSLEVSEGATLVFSSVGFTTEEVEVGSRSVIDLVMTSDIQQLQELVVVGYGTQRKSDLTGALSSIKGEDLHKVSERRLENALQGKAAGVMISRGEGSPGSGSSIHIRGAGSIGNTEPLWIVDGIRMGPGNHLNIRDVESVEVLKDASAAAIYGAQAAHGVILVTTKRGKTQKDKINVELNASIGQRSPLNLPDMLGTPDFVRASTEARVNAGQDPEEAWNNPGSLPNTNWVDEVYGGNGLEQSYNLAIAGATENANYYVSAGYDRENGVMIDNWFERYSIRVNTDFSIGKKLKIGETLYVSKTQEDPTAESGRDLERIFRAIPIMPIRDESNPYGGWGTAPTYFQGANPVANEYQTHRFNLNNRINGNVYADYQIIQGLNLRATFGANISGRRDDTFNEAFDYGANSNTINSLQYLSNDFEQYTFNIVGTYEKTFGKHDLKVLAGYETVSTEIYEFSASAQNFPLQYAKSFALATGDLNIPNRNTFNEDKILSQFGRINYVFNDRYLFTANIRRDGSSKFGPGNQFGIFPSVSAGWTISNESFMQSLSLVSNLKLRASWGVLGSDAIGRYIFSRTYRNNRSTYAFDETGVDGGSKVRGFYLRRLPNEDVKWEEIEQTNIGADLGIWEDKLTLTADYYIKNTVDMLLDVQLPPSAGISQSRSNPESPDVNIGEIQNRGFELMVTYQDNIGDWDFTISGNTAFNSNEVKQLNEDDFIMRGGGGTAFQGYSLSRTEAGQPMGSFWGWIADGIFQSDSEVQQLNDGVEGNYQENNTTAGDLKYRDINGEDANGNILVGQPDGKITRADLTYIGNPWPKMIYGLNANVAYKGFDLTLFFQGVQGVDIFNANKAYYRTVFSDYNTSDLVFNRWTPENPTSHPRLIATDPNGNFRKPSSYFIEDGSYLKLRNIQLGYTLPNRLINNMGLANARVFINAQNIITLTAYEGMDPELAGGNTSRGIDGQGQYPQTKLISTGVQINF